jgi:hypothetical protein
VDVIGAEDSFNARFLHAFVHGAALNDCLALGMRVALTPQQRAEELRHSPILQVYNGFSKAVASPRRWSCDAHSQAEKLFC